ncbi:MAG: DUF4364 family protein [Candidatus Bathyarchaeia archaeon]
MANYKTGSLAFPTLERVLIPKFGKRDRITITLDILESVRSSKFGKKKTNIMQSANLNYYQINKYLHFLVSNGFLEHNGEYYQITEKGIEFIKNFEVYKPTLG